MLPLFLYKMCPPGVTGTPEAPKAARESLRSMGRLTRDEWVVAVAFAFMVTGWVMAGATEVESRCGGVRRPGGAPCHQCPHTGGHQLTGRYPDHFYLAGSALCIEQPELYRLGLLTTFFCLFVFLATGTPWLILLARWASGTKAGNASTVGSKLGGSARSSLKT